MPVFWFYWSMKPRISKRVKVYYLSISALSKVAFLIISTFSVRFKLSQKIKQNWNFIPKPTTFGLDKLIEILKLV